MLGTRELLRFLPSQRRCYLRATNEISLPSLPTPRFSQPFSGSYAEDNSRVYSTPQALPGFTPSELGFETISHGHSVRMLLRRYLSCMASFLVLIDNPAITTAEDYPYPRPLSDKAPRLLAKTGFHFGLGPTLKLCSCPDASSIAPRFHPRNRTRALLAFLSFRVTH